VATFLRVVFLLLSGTAIACAVGVQNPEWAQRLGFKGEWIDQDQQPISPDEENQLILRRIDAKEHVTCELLDGQLTLFEAATIFLHLDEQTPNAFSQPPYLGFSKEEAACRQVIEWARQRLRSQSPNTAERVITHFEEEMRRQKEQDKPLCL
jgi:hypothetical protein